MNYSNIPIVNLNDLEKGMLLEEHRVADFVVRIIGSWKFIVIQTIVLVFWTILNIVAFFEHWDPYPFILLNLILSLQAAYAAPIIMMSQNRQAARDRIEAHNDYLVNLKSEKDISIILERLEAQNKMIINIQHLLLAKETEKAELTE